MHADFYQGKILKMLQNSSNHTLLDLDLPATVVIEEMMVNRKQKLCLSHNKKRTTATDTADIISNEFKLFSYTYKFKYLCTIIYPIFEKSFRHSTLCQLGIWRFCYNETSII